MELVNILLLAVLGICTGLAAGSIWKNRKKHGCCGDCTNCAGCSGCTHEKK